MKKKPELLKGALAGALGGLLGAWLMNYSHQAWRKGMGLFQEAIGDEDDEASQRDDESSEDENATAKVAEAISETVFRHKLTDDERKPASIAVHFGFGASMGALYGAIAEIEPRATFASGIPFGTVLWLGADEVVVPVAGFSKNPGQYPISTHADALMAHLVFGLTTDLVRRGVRSIG